jgi:cytochrome oxidase Cu insertion factor (SCO1/SenC/PrrC family)
MGKSDHYELLSAINTLRAGWLELRLARLFGTRIECIGSDGMKVTQALYKGRLYLLDFRYTKVA